MKNLNCEQGIINLKCTKTIYTMYELPQKSFQ